jgi:hypothetical protein
MIKQLAMKQQANKTLHRAAIPPRPITDELGRWLFRKTDMDQAEIQRQFFRPICNEQEIDRIFDVQNAADYLLKLRAETIVDHMRLFRVYRNKALAKPENWSLERSFDKTHFQRFLDHVDPDVVHKCSEVTFGNMFSNDPNGTIFATDYGPIVTISESLSFFLKFAHLALLEFDSKVPQHVRINALRVAIRVMLKTEAMDFYMDPRGIMPKDVAEAIHAPIPLQMEFIAGHEFAHHILGHLSPISVTDKPIFCAITPRDKDYMLLPVFSQSQEEELDADKQAVLLLKKNEQHRTQVLDAALLWFGCLELYKAVVDFMHPSAPWVPVSHPSARQRFEQLLSGVPIPLGYDDSRSKRLLKTIDVLKPILVEDVSVNIETYEMYGSVYLDKPDSEWRGPKLVDRKDYY